MTTANRPTWHAKVGGSSSISTTQVSSKDQKGFTQMKYRQIGQSSKDEMITKDLKAELNLREESLLIKDNNNSSSSNNNNNIDKKDLPKLLTYKPIITNDIINKYDDADADANDNSDNDLESSDDDSDDDDDDGEDDELELLRELERIKAERALAQEKKEREEREEAERKNRESALKGNPLLDLDGSYDSTLKRKWNDDVVFRNQTKGEQEVKKRFINDTIRNDFHKSFLKKYINL